jgi:hypothetical protein
MPKWLEYMGGMRSGAIQKEGPVCLKIRAGGNQVQPDFTQFVSIFMITVAEVCDYFDAFPYNGKSLMC